MSNVILDEVKMKLARLKALQANPGTDGEAEAATAAINRLMLKYNLELLDVPDLEQDETFVKESFNVSEELGASDLRWKTTLISVLAKFNFCQAIADTGYNNRIDDTVFIVGKPSNIGVVKALYLSIATQIDTEALKALNVSVTGRQINARKYRNSFRLGAVTTIYNRFQAQRRADLADVDNSHALVSTLDAQLKHAVGNMVGPTSMSKSKSKIAPSAYGAGKTAGESVKIQGEMNATKRALNGGRLALGTGR